MAFQEYIEIERVEKLIKKEFIENYYKPQKPVVITNQIDDWPAYSKWNFPFLKEVVGDKTVHFTITARQIIPKMSMSLILR
jgi:hypothetical protein